MTGPRELARQHTVWLPFRPGPAGGETGDVIVSVTDFRAHRLRDLARIYVDGLRLREGWYAMPGAVGLWLWAQPLARGRGGSVSVWKSESELRRFVALPAHVAIMRRYRTLGTLKSSTWKTDHSDLDAIRAVAAQTIRTWGA